jgi:hypothetical protein
MSTAGTIETPLKLLTSGTHPWNISVYPCIGRDLYRMQSLSKLLTLNYKGNSLVQQPR